MEGTAVTNGIAGDRSAPPPSNARCVLWHDPLAGPECAATVGQLEARLRDRGVGVVRAGSAAAALAELCVIARGEGEHGRGPLSLVVVEPRSRPDAGALACAVIRYVPHAVIWAFETEPAPVLRPAPAGETGEWPGAIPSPREPQVVVTASDNGAGSGNGEPQRRDARPPLRLTGDPGSAQVSRPASDEENAGGAPRSHELLTQEELAMLLADDAPDR